MQGCLTTGTLRWPAVLIFGDFSSFFDAMVSDTGPFFRHGTICWFLSSLRLLWSRWFPSTLCPLLLFDMCDYLVITGYDFQMSGPEFLLLCNASAASRRVPTVTLSSSLCASVCTCVACLGAHSSSASPIRWLTVYLCLRAALQ